MLLQSCGACFKTSTLGGAARRQKGKDILLFEILQHKEKLSLTPTEMSNARQWNTGTGNEVFPAGSRRPDAAQPETSAGRDWSSPENHRNASEPSRHVPPWMKNIAKELTEI